MSAPATYPRVPEMTPDEIMALLNAGAELVADKPYAECDSFEKALAQRITCIEAGEVQA